MPVWQTHRHILARALATVPGYQRWGGRGLADRHIYGAGGTELRRAATPSLPAMLAMTITGCPAKPGGLTMVIISAKY